MPVLGKLVKEFLDQPEITVLSCLCLEPAERVGHMCNAHAFQTCVVNMHAPNWIHLSCPDHELYKHQKFIAQCKG